MTKPLRVGDILHDFWNGPPGATRPGDKRVEAIGADWAVLRYVAGLHDNGVELYEGDPDELCRYRLAMLRQGG